MRQPFEPRSLRRTILGMAYYGSSVHIACAFSIVEILAVLYGKHLRYPDGRPDHPSRDYLILSKGHGVMAQYACLLEMGWIAPHELTNYYKDGTRLYGLAEAWIPGVEVTSGSLGHGLSIGAGLALAAKRHATEQMCYAVVGDGETNEGSVWEALQFAAQQRLDNLIVIVDKNDFQAMGRTADILAPGDMVAKFAAFGFDTMLVDGHDQDALHAALSTFKMRKNGQPKGIIAKTVKGRGVSFMENSNLWHYTRLDATAFAAALGELGPAGE